MKNIHIIPTDKPSRLFITDGKLFNYHKPQQGDGIKIINQNIYITCDEEIKEGDWCHTIGTSLFNEQIGKVTKQVIADNGKYSIVLKKIILTTDQDLIKDGIQAIDDEFLEWFVKNPSCEYVEVQHYVVGTGFTHTGKTPSKQELLRGCYDNGEQIIGKWEDCYKYKIIIPKEEPKQISLVEKMKPLQEQWQKDMDKALQEPKQETLEEAAEQFEYTDGIYGFKQGAKWQAERMYSEKEVKHIVSEALESSLVTFDLEQWFKQFKKKL